MTIWYILILVLFILVALEVAGLNQYSALGEYRYLSKGNLTLNKLIFIFIACVLTFLSAFRFETGRDWSAYIRMFNNAEQLFETGSVERGYIAINLFFRKIGLSYWTMQACILLFCSYCLYGEFYKKSSYPLYTLAIYFCLYFFSNDLAQTRQYLAMSVLILCWRFVEKKKFVFWVIAIIFAMQFHITAITAFPLYFTNRIKIKPWFSIFMLLGCFFINVFALDLIWKIIEFTVTIKILPDRVASILQYYINSDIYNKQAEYSSGLGLLVNYVFYFIVLFLYYVKYKNKKIDESCVFNFLIGILFSSMGRNFSQFSRIGNYYMLCGGGILTYNIIPESFVFFKKIDVARFGISLLWILFLLYNFYVVWLDEIEYIYRTFLLK